MKSKINFLLAALTTIILLQSCLKDHNPIIQLPDDKLLLSKVTGVYNTNTFYVWNNFEYTLDSTRKFWNYLANYSYGKEHFGWDNCKPIEKIGFHNAGSWDFSYNNFLPDKVTDNSIPGKDEGYWKFYYNDKGQIIKTGLAFSITTEPTEFEFYGYDDHSNLTDIVYGKHVDTPLYKLTYVYDATGNVTQWQYLSAIGYKNADVATGRQIFSSLANLPETEKAMGKTFAGIMKKVISKSNNSNFLSGNSYFKISPTNLVGDSNVIYENYITGNITNDGRINPYHQQGKILFYITSRNYTSDIDAYPLQLEKSNTLSAQYIINPDYGGYAPMTSSFTYSYNKQGYPVTSHEQTTDPDGIWLGPNFIYTQDRNYEYISNH